MEGAECELAAMTDDLFPLQDTLDLALRAEFEREQQPQTLGPWKRASGLGNCLRAQILEMRGVTPTKVYSAKEIRRFQHGKLIHREVQRQYDDLGILIAEEVSLVDQDLTLTGHADMIVGGPVQFVGPEEPHANALSALRFEVMNAYGTEMAPALVELKPTNSRAMKYAEKQGPSDHHMLQLAGYYLLAERNPEQMPVKVESYLLGLIGKDWWGMLRFPLTSSWIAKAEKVIERINDAWAKGDLPPCTCPSYWTEYCSYPTYEGEKAIACCEVSEEAAA